MAEGGDGGTASKMAADSGMDTSCPSPENADSRKRPLDSDVDDGTAKKSNCSSGEWTTVSCVCRGPLASDGRRRLLLSLGGRGWQGPSIIATLVLFIIIYHFLLKYYYGLLFCRIFIAKIVRSPDLFAWEIFCFDRADNN